MAKVVSESTFATGGSGQTKPDSVTYGAGHLWVEYGNGADSTGKPSVGSTIVEYNLDGTIKHSFTVAGSVDGLKIDPNTGIVWALQNQDGNSTLTLINPVTNAVSTAFTYQAPPYVYGATSGRGYDDVAFIGNKVYVSYTNPANSGDSVLQQLTNGEAPFGTLTTTSILAAGAKGLNLETGKVETIPLSDPDSLKATPGGGLVQTSGGDSTFVLISQPGTAQQSESFVTLQGLPKGAALDDVIIPGAASGTLYVTDQTHNRVVKIELSGLTSSQAIVSVGSEIGIVDEKTGLVTALVTDVGKSHGMDFVPNPAPPSVKVISETTFATGAAGQTKPDSVTYGNGQLWVEYGNGVDSTGKPSVGSTIVEYNLDGTIKHSFAIAGSVDGLKIDPNTGIVWALQNQDGNSTLTLINPVTNAVSTAFTYQSPPYVYGANSGRGYDDVAFIGNKVYVSYTNPANPGDSVLQVLTNGEAPFGTLTTRGILSFGAKGLNLEDGKIETIPLNDPDSLKATPGGGLVQTSSADNTFVLISNPDTAKQSASFVTLQGLPKGAALDDVIVPGAASGTLYVTDQTNNRVVKIELSGLTSSQAIVSIGSEVGIVDEKTGLITALVTNVGKSHGMDFVPKAPAAASTVKVLSESTFATGAAGQTKPDSVTYGAGHLWVEYGNGVDSTGKPSVGSTIVEYNLDGTIKHSFTIAGSVDGLKVDPNTGIVWALQNQDGNSTLTLINPVTNAVSTAFTYQSPPYVYGANSGRGYDDVAFIGNKVYVSYTNPANPGDSVLQVLTNGEAPFGTLTTRGILSFGAKGLNLEDGKIETIPLNDPDSLKATPGGGLVQTSSADNTFVLISNPDTAKQSASFVTLQGLPKGAALDDVIVPGAASGTLYVTDQTNNRVVKIELSGLTSSQAIVSIGSEVGIVDEKTGLVTALVTNVGKSHGMEFVAAPPAPIVTSQGILVNAPTGSSQPDSLTLADGSLWVQYGNGADSTGKGGTSTIVEYDRKGVLLHSYTVAGSADGLKFDALTGDIFVLQNQDGNSTLTLLDPRTGHMSDALKYAAPYVYGASSSRGYDDVAFSGGHTFLSYSNPGASGDGVLQELVGVNTAGQLVTTTVLKAGDTGTNLLTGQTGQALPVSDPDSLKTLADGTLVLTSGNDASLVFIKGAGTSHQTESFITLPAGSSGLDDAIVPTSSSGTFYVSDTGNNRVVDAHVVNLNTNDLYVSLSSSNAIVQIDPTTGVITPIVTGLTSPHGIVFQPDSGTTGSVSSLATQLMQTVQDTFGIKAAAGLALDQGFRGVLADLGTGGNLSASYVTALNDVQQYFINHHA